MCRRGIASWLIVIAVTLSLGTAWGRPVKFWPYHKLFENADLVIIAKPLAVRDAPEVDKAMPLPRERSFLLAVITTLKVEYVVKGNYKDERLELVHFRLKEGSQIGNGPLLVNFHTKVETLKGSDWAFSCQPEYMLFLKKAKNGRFECVSGQYDPELSVKEILRPLP
jgi:hypothetical protein